MIELKRLRAHIIAAAKNEIGSPTFNVKITAIVTDITDKSLGAKLGIFIVVLLALCLYAGTYFQLTKKVDFFKPFRKKPPTAQELRRI